MFSSPQVHAYSSYQGFWKPGGTLRKPETTTSPQRSPEKAETPNLAGNPDILRSDAFELQQAIIQNQRAIWMLGVADHAYQQVAQLLQQIHACIYEGIHSTHPSHYPLPQPLSSKTRFIENTLAQARQILRSAQFQQLALLDGSRQLRATVIQTNRTSGFEAELPIAYATLHDSAAPLHLHIQAPATRAQLSFTADSCTQDLLLEVSGSLGRNVFAVSAETSLGELADFINRAAMVTGVAAREFPHRLELISTDWGAQATVSLKALRGSLLTHDSLGRPTSFAQGSDLVALVNNRPVVGQGLYLQAVLPQECELGLVLPEELNRHELELEFVLTSTGVSYAKALELSPHRFVRFGLTAVDLEPLDLAASHWQSLLQPTSSGNSQYQFLACSVLAAVNQQRRVLSQFSQNQLQAELTIMQKTLLQQLEASSPSGTTEPAVSASQEVRHQITKASALSGINLLDRQPHNVLSLLQTPTF